MKTHTPGPWAVEDPIGADVGLWIVQSGLEPRQWSCIAIVTDDEDGSARDEGGRFIGRTEQEANARLIAAAPDLLDALKLCQAALATMIAPEAIKSTTVLNAFAQATEADSKGRAAIAKAEGRS